KQKRDFGQHRFAGDQGKLKGLPCFSGPFVIRIAPGSIGNQRSGIQQGTRPHRPKSSKYFLLVDRSDSPLSSIPYHSFIRSCALSFGLRVLRSGVSPGCSSTRRNPSTTRSFSLRPRKAASDLARRNSSSGMSIVVRISCI